MKWTNEQFLTKALIIHGTKYDYSETEYDGADSKVRIKCNRCNDYFLQRAADHLNGNGCRKCGLSTNKSNKDEFVRKANLKHGDKYDYSKVEYMNSRTKVIIICEKHGEFEMTPNMHLNGSCCPDCKKSSGELKIKQWLQDNNVLFQNQKKFSDCINSETKYLLSFDFYLPDHNMCIEFQGIQHYVPISFSSNRTEEFMVSSFEKQKGKDRIKREYCIKNGIQLLLIPYWKESNLEKYLEENIIEQH